MTALGKGALVAVVDAVLILALAWSAARDVDRWPQGWAEAVIGRDTAPGSHYVTLELQVPTRDFPINRPNGPCRLQVQEDRVVCTFSPEGSHWIPPGRGGVFRRSLRYRLPEADGSYATGTRVQAQVSVSADGRLRVLRIAPFDGR